MKFQNLPLFLLLLFCFILEAQNNSNNSILSFEDKLLVKANINTQSETFSIIDSNERITIEALNSFKLQLSANYKFVGFSLGFSPSSKNGDFKSEFLETELRFFINKWIQTVNYRRVKGFYLQNVSTDNIERQYPDLKTTSYFGSTSYVFNDNFSLKHVLHQNEWQRFTAGSFIPAIRYGFNRVSDVFENDKLIQNNFDLILSPSYYYTWCLKKHWFVAPNISPELGVRFSKDKTNTTNNSQTYLTKALTLGLQFGYTSTKVSAGAMFNFTSTSVNNKSSRNLTNDRNFANIYFGYRLDPPRVLERNVEKVNKFLGL